MSFTICSFSSRTKPTGENLQLSWDGLKKKFSTPAVTHETQAEFKTFTKDRQTEIKDVGGFVAGYLKEGKRGKATVQTRSLVVLDADYADDSFRENVRETFDGYAYILYPTHKSQSGARKYRLIFPLEREVSYEEYEPVARWLADRVGMDTFDPTTYQPERLMFFPSISKDAEYDYLDADGLNADPDLILSTYPDWRDHTCWKHSPKEDIEFKRVYAKAEKADPLTKKGIIGAFCRAFSISEAIERFLPDVYIPADSSNRYTYSSGTTSGGLVVYSGKFAYSHHATDPAAGELLNAFDLVRVHLFKDLDNDSKAFGDSLPSFREMKKLASEQPEVKKELVAEKTDAFDDFAEELAGADEDWREKLTMNAKSGEILTNPRNIKIVLEHDENLKDRLAFDMMASRPVKLGWMPWDTPENTNDKSWRDTDDAALRNYLEDKYNLRGPARVADALSEVLNRHAFHPVRDYLNGLEWDGVPRLDTLLADYLGADDSEYTRAVTRKAFTACVARVFEPGCKFDYMLLMIGSQGRGKSQFLSAMGGNWFSDTITSIGRKESYEALDGSWIVEMAEMTAAKKADIEALKQFISKRSDKYRKAYDRRVTENPRQCVFFGTTNEDECLRDYTGNRRFWVVEVHDRKAKKNIFKDLPQERNQLWAEAVARYKAEEPLFLDDRLEQMAREAQKFHTFESSRWADIQYYLEYKLPAEWDSMKVTDRIIYLEDHNPDEGEIERMSVCTKEIWIECCGGNARNFGPSEQRDIAACLKSLGWTRDRKQTRDPVYGVQKRFSRGKKVA